MIFKALSIMQPWAWLIASGFKDVENRTWRSDFTGRIFIHAGMKRDSEGEKWVKQTYPHIILPTFAQGINMGGIVGAVDIVGCITRGCKYIQPTALHRYHESEWLGPDFAFCLENPEIVPFIRMPGKLRFFNVEVPQ